MGDENTSGNNFNGRWNSHTELYGFEYNVIMIISDDLVTFITDDGDILFGKFYNGSTIIMEGYTEEDVDFHLRYFLVNENRLLITNLLPNTTVDFFKIR